MVCCNLKYLIKISFNCYLIALLDLFSHSSTISKIWFCCAVEPNTGLYQTCLQWISVASAMDITEDHKYHWYYHESYHNPIGVDCRISIGLDCSNSFFEAFVSWLTNLLVVSCIVMNHADYYRATLMVLIAWGSLLMVGGLLRLVKTPSSKSGIWLQGSF